MADAKRFLTVGRLVALMFIVGGLFHAALPWMLGYQEVWPATVNHVASGLGLAVLGGIKLVLGRWAWWATAAAALVGVWMLVSPLALDYGHHPSSANDALWGGGFTLLFAGLAALTRIITPAAEVRMG